jgi:hypothetical protein
MSAEFQYDVFLSHNSKDKPQVRQLAERLRAAGLRVWFDEWVIQPGDDIYLAIERGLEAARVQVLCLSPAALGSDWVALERSTVLFRDPTNADRRFVPVLLADCKLPDTLRRYKYVDLREDTDAAFKQLLSTCQSPKKRAGKRGQAAGVESRSRSAGQADSPVASGNELAGHWTATARQEGGEPYEIFLTFRVMDKLLLGSVSYPMGNGSIVNGKIDGDTLSFQTQHIPRFSSQEVTIQWYGKIVGQALRGFAGQAEFTAKRSTTPQRYGWKGEAE